MRLSERDKQVIKDFLGSECVSRVELFGSYAEGGADSDSDVDLPVEFPETRSLLEMARIERELSEKLGIKVDLVTKESLSPHIRSKISDIEVLMA